MYLRVFLFCFSICVLLSPFFSPLLRYSLFFLSLCQLRVSVKRCPSRPVRTHLVYMGPDNRPPENGGYPCCCHVRVYRQRAVHHTWFQEVYLPFKKNLFVFFFSLFFSLLEVCMSKAFTNKVFSFFFFFAKFLCYYRAKLAGRLGWGLKRS